MCINRKHLCTLRTPLLCYKNVLTVKDVLQEHKRYTDHGVSSTPYAIQSQGGKYLSRRGRYLGQGVGTSVKGVGTLVRGALGTLGYPLPCQDLTGGIGTLAGG